MGRLWRLLLSACAAAGFGAALPAQAASTADGHKVLAFYYGWYGNKTVSGHWVHWKPNDGGQTADNIAGMPADGLYDSHDPAEVARQVAEARQAGIDAFVATWWGPGDFTDKGMPVLLEAARPTGLKATVLIEALHAKDDEGRHAEAVRDLLYIVRNYGSDPAWLHVGGKPVVFIYGRAEHDLSPDAWRQVLEDVRAQSPTGLVAIGAGYAQWLEAFDGGMNYSLTDKIHAMDLPRLQTFMRGYYGQLVETAHSEGKISAVMINPGFDDTHTGRPPPRPVLERRDGQTYAALWQATIQSGADWAVVASFNEWHEGSGIEPSAAYGDAYLRETKVWADRFKGTGGPGRPAP
jgi:hypothetical protein